MKSVLCNTGVWSLVGDVDLCGFGVDPETVTEWKKWGREVWQSGIVVERWSCHVCRLAVWFTGASLPSSGLFYNVVSLSPNLSFAFPFLSLSTLLSILKMEWSAYLLGCCVANLWPHDSLNVSHCACKLALIYKLVTRAFAWSQFYFICFFFFFLVYSLSVVVGILKI